MIREAARRAPASPRVPARASSRSPASTGTCRGLGRLRPCLRRDVRTLVTIVFLLSGKSPPFMTLQSAVAKVHRRPCLAIRRYDRKREKGAEALQDYSVRISPRDLRSRRVGLRVFGRADRILAWAVTGPIFGFSRYLATRHQHRTTIVTSDGLLIQNTRNATLCSAREARRADRPHSRRTQQAGDGRRLQRPELKEARDTLSR